MRTFVFFSFILISITILTNCNNKDNFQASTKTQLDTLDINPTTDSILDKTKIAWAGDYAGTIPATNIIGMKMKLSLSSFNKYKLEIKTLHDNPKDNKTLFFNGDMKWQKDSLTFSLMGIDSISNKFKLNKNEIIYLNPDGTPNSGSLAEFYKLKKTVKK